MKEKVRNPFRIELGDLNPTRFNLFRWMDKAAENEGSDYVRRHKIEPIVRFFAFGTYSILTSPLSVPLEFYRANKKIELSRKFREKK